MKKSVLLFLFLLAATTLWADDYIILKMNTETIEIGIKTCRPGDIFSDESVIYWKGEKQAFRAQNLKTKKIYLFAAPAFQNSGSRTIKEYYVKNNYLSTRGGLFSLEDLAEEIGDTLYLWEKTKIESPYPLNSTSYFYLSYKDSASRNIQKELESDNDSIIIDKNIFNNEINKDGIHVSLRYSNKLLKEDSSVKDSLFIYIIPDNL